MKLDLPETRDILEANYSPHEVEVLWKLFRILETMPVAEAIEEGRSFLRRLWPDEIEYLSKTSWIQRKQDLPCLLEPNFAQKKFWEDVVLRCREENRPMRAIILKARQLGFSTLVSAIHYMWCSTNPHRHALTISYDDDSGNELLAKCKFIHDHLFFPLQTSRDSTGRIEFSKPHHSSFRVITAGGKGMGRSYTFQHVHCSEIPFWGNADLVLTGLAQTVSPTALDTSVFWESTAQGMAGVFYDGWVAAESGASSYIPFFAPWFWNPEYETSFQSDDHMKQFMRSLNYEDVRYMDAYGLSEEQMNWRSAKINEPGMTRPKFKQEFPACAEEAFISSGTPVFDQEMILELTRNAKSPEWQGGIVCERA